MDIFKLGFFCGGVYVGARFPCYMTHAFDGRGSMPLEEIGVGECV